MKQVLVNIAIDRYSSPYICQLKNPVYDAESFREVLVRRYGLRVEDVYTLYDDKATISAITALLSELSGKLTSDDSLIIYYAGHGTRIRDNGYILPYEANSRNRSTLLSTRQIVNLLKPFVARHILFIADSCYSRSILTEKTQFSPRGPESVMYSLHSSRFFISSGFSAVSDGLPGKHSPFANSLLQFMEDADQPFLVTDLLQHLKHTVAAREHQLPQGGRIGPLNDEGGEYVFLPYQTT